MNAPIAASLSRSSAANARSSPRFARRRASRSRASSSVDRLDTASRVPDPPVTGRVALRSFVTGPASGGREDGYA